MTNIVPAPDVALSSQFPTNADRVAGVFNAKAAAWADSSRAMAADMDAAAKSAATNAQAAEERAVAADQSAQDANQYKLDAQAARDSAQGAAVIVGRFDKLYLGPKAEFPSLDNEGGALQIGAEFFHTVLKARYSWSGTEWLIGTSVSAGVSQVGGKAGALSIADTSYPAATAQELEEGEETALRSVSPKDLRTAVMASAPELAGVLPSLLPEALPPGSLILGNTAGLKEPDWLRMGASYLVNAYPITARNMGFVFPSTLITSRVHSTVNGSMEGTACASSSEASLLVAMHGRDLITVHATENNELVTWPNFQYTSHQYNQHLAHLFLTPDGNYLLVSYVVTIYGEPNSYACGVRLLKRNGNAWQHAAWVVPETVNTTRHRRWAVMSDDALDIFVSRSAAETALPAFTRYTFNPQTNAVTNMGAPTADMPTDAAPYAEYMLHYAKGKLLLRWSYGNAATGYAYIYDTLNGYAKTDFPTLAKPASLEVLGYTSDRRFVLIASGYFASSYRFEAFDMEIGAHYPALSFSNSENIKGVFFPREDGKTVAWLNASSGGSRAAVVSEAGVGALIDGRYPNPVGLDVVCTGSISGGRTLSFSVRGGSVYLWGHKTPETFSLPPSWVLPPGAGSVSPSHPYHFFARSYD